MINHDEVARTNHIDRDYDDQSIQYRIADLLEEILAELRKIKENTYDD